MVNQVYLDTSALAKFRCRLARRRRAGELSKELGTTNLYHVGT